jgi:hypothetical protein
MRIDNQNKANKNIIALNSQQTQTHSTLLNDETHKNSN